MLGNSGKGFSKFFFADLVSELYGQEQHINENAANINTEIVTFRTSALFLINLSDIPYA
jgi:hypothetical protein